MVEFDFLEIKHVWDNLASTSPGVFLGMEPITVSHVVKRPEGALEQLGSIGEENGVYHRKYEGTIAYYPASAFHYVEGITVSWIPKTYPPILYCKPVGYSSEFMVGNYLIPQTGAYVTWFNPYNKYWFGGVWESYRVRYVIGNTYLERWYDANFSSYATYSCTVGYCTEQSEILNILVHFDGFKCGNLPCTTPTTGAFRHATNIVGALPSQVMESVLPMCPVPDRYPYLEGATDIWWNLTRSAVDTMDALDVNSISFLKELGEWRRLLPPLPKSKKALLSKKTWSSFYLWLRYGLTLSISDSKEIIAAIPRLQESFKSAVTAKKRRLRARRTLQVLSNGETWSCQLGLRVLMDTFPEDFRAFGNFADGLHNLDLYPTTANLWDLIPLSFVLDWFIPVQDWLSSVDTALRTLNFQIYCVTTSTKWSRSVPPPHVPGYVTSGLMSEVHYIRGVSTALPSPVLCFESEKGPVTSTTIYKRIADGIALLIQRRG